MNALAAREVGQSTGGQLGDDLRQEAGAIARSPDAARPNGAGDEAAAVGAEDELLGQRLGLRVQVHEARRIRIALINGHLIAIVGDDAGAADEHEAADAVAARGVDEGARAGDVGVPELTARAEVADARGRVVDDVDAARGGGERLGLGDVAGDELDGASVAGGNGGRARAQMSRVARRPNERAHVVTGGEAVVDEVAAQEAGGAGDEDLHVLGPTGKRGRTRRPPKKSAELAVTALRLHGRKAKPGVTSTAPEQCAVPAALAVPRRGGAAKPGGTSTPRPKSTALRGGAAKLGATSTPRPKSNARRGGTAKPGARSTPRPKSTAPPINAFTCAAPLRRRGTSTTSRHTRTCKPPFASASSRRADRAATP